MATLRKRVLCLVLGSLTIAGCRSEARKTRADSRGASTTASAPAPAAQDTRVVPRIVSVSPETIGVRDGHADGGTYVMEYEIDNPERVESARVQVYAPGIGEV